MLSQSRALSYKTYLDALLCQGIRVGRLNQSQKVLQHWPLESTDEIP